MKRCPTCQKTFDDAMRFCQTDGTPLVEDATPSDPYKTMVASKEDIQAALSGQPGSGPASAGIGAPEEEPLEIPSTPESEFETKLAGRDDAQVIEIPPLSETAPPEPPRFNEPSAPPPSFGEPSAPPSPFGASSREPETSGSRDFPTTPPIPSPFGGSEPPKFDEPKAEAAPTAEADEEKTYFQPESYSPPEPAPSFNEPPASPFAEPEAARPASEFSPFEQHSEPASPVAQSQWTPPSPPMQQSNNPGGQFNPPATGQKLNQTLPIVSLVFGIISICCWFSPLTGLVALVTGFLGMKNANNNPSQYGGKTMAIIGMVLGGLLWIVGIAYWVFVVFFNGAAVLMQMANQAQ